MKRRPPEPDIDEAMRLLDQLQADLHEAQRRNRERMDELRRSIHDD